MVKSLLYFIVAMAGAAVLAIEILGTRILGPFYGVSLYLWSSLISVTLLSLSLGYFLGGRWADSNPNPNRLAVILAAAGVWLLIIPFLKHPLLLFLQPLGLRAALLCAAMFLFVPPLTLLGMVSPFAIKLNITDLDKVGRTAGNLYAISTIASVFAALITGFYLIPFFGVKKLVYAIGLLLIFCAILIFARKKNRKSQIPILLILALIFSLAIWKIPDKTPHPENGLMAIKQSPYAEISVLDRDDDRYLLIDGAIHTAIRQDDFKSVMQYTVAIDLTRFLFDRTGDLLLIGLGGGCIAKSFAGDGWRVDAVEIDPLVVDFAHQFFGLDNSHARIFIMDGRQYLNQNNKKYDLIVLDAFGSSSIPFHLTTQEVFALIHEHLQTEGVFALNVETVGWRHPLVYSIARTLSTIFKHVIALPLHEPPNVAGNVVLMAADKELSFPEDWLGQPLDYIYDDYAHWVVVQRNHAWDNRFVPDFSKAALLTDDLNPSDIWAEEINKETRKILMQEPLLDLTW